VLPRARRTLEIKLGAISQRCCPDLWEYLLTRKGVAKLLAFPCDVCDLELCGFELGFDPLAQFVLPLGSIAFKYMQQILRAISDTVFDLQEMGQRVELEEPLTCQVDRLGIDTWIHAPDPVSLAQ